MKLFDDNQLLALVPPGLDTVYKGFVEHFENSEEDAPESDGQLTPEAPAGAPTGASEEEETQIMESFRNKKHGGNKKNKNKHNKRPKSEHFRGGGEGRMGGGGGGRMGGGGRWGGGRGGGRWGGGRGGGFYRGGKWYSPRYSNRYYYYPAYSAATGYYDPSINYYPWGINIYDYPQDYYYDPALVDYSTFGVVDPTYIARSTTFPLIESKDGDTQVVETNSNMSQWLYLFLAAIFIIGVLAILKR